MSGIERQFTGCLRLLIGEWENRGYQLVAYLDDFLLICKDYATSLQGQLTLIALLRMLGFSISWPKVVGPTHKKYFLVLKLIL